ncbi:MAG: amidohydrolase family protein [Candidatus Bathyarchaeota archaeon]
MTTIIEGGIVVGFDGERHRILRDGVVVFDEERIIHVGKSYQGRVDERVDAEGKLVTPGFINTHSHSQTPISPHHLTIDIDLDPYYQHAGIGMHITKRGATRTLLDPEKWSKVALLSLVKRLLSGTTTFIEVGGGNEELVRLTDEVGIRGYIAPGYKSATWIFDEKGRFGYEWDEEKGWKDFDRAVEFIEKHHGSAQGRIRGMLFPAQVDTCTPELFEETREKADQLGIGIQTHVGQRLIEFQEIVRRHLKTPVQFLHGTGLLGPGFIAGHCIFASGHSKTAWPGHGDQRLLAGTGSSIAYCPVVFTKNAVAMESFGRNIRLGVNMTIGTDNFPQDIINEMRWASMLSKVVDFDRTSASSAEAFNAVTLNAAKALRRNDIGRLQEGAKPDIVIINLHTTRIAPVYDPIKSLVNAATSDNVEKVYCDGELLVDQGKVLGLDEETLLGEVQEIAEANWAKVSEWDYAQRGLSEYAPLSFEEKNA